MNNKHSKHNKGNVQTSEEAVVVKVKKEKTPSGHFRYNGKLYPMTFQNLPKEKIWCHYCKAHNAKVIGLIKVEDTHRFVIKCSFHGSYTMDLLSFKRQFPLVILPDELNKLLSPEGYPIQHSYCKECRGTTGKVIGESEDGRKWHIHCKCGQDWFESKDSFEKKYIGDENNPPLYMQTAPKSVKLPDVQNTGNSEGEKPFARALMGFVPAKKVKDVSPKQDFESLERPEVSKPSNPKEISIKIPDGTTPCVKYSEGYLLISFN